MNVCKYITRFFITYLSKGTALRLFQSLFLFLIVTIGADAQIVINEASSANLYTVYDEDSDAEDWIELYNKSNDTLSLKGFFLSDKKSEPRMWEIPDVEIYPDSFALFFASGKNRRNVIDHWETAVYCDSLWRYLNPDYEPDAQWEWPAFSDTSWNEGRGGFGFGDDDDTTVTCDTLRTIYLRKTFFVQDTAAIINAIMHVDYDDGFVVYLNGRELLRENIQPDGKTPHYLQTAMWPTEAQMYQGGLPGMFVINEPLLKRYLKNGENTLAIQCHNFWDDDDMTIKPWLSLAMRDTCGQFGMVPEWFFAEEIPLHTNFGIRSSGEKIYLFNPFGMLIDEVDVKALAVDNSYGRMEDGSDSLVYFSTPTPGYSNDTSYAMAFAIDVVPEISPATGYFNDSVLINIISPDTCLLIRYSLDGSVPTNVSPLFTVPFYLDTTVVVRARLFKEGYMPSKTTTQTLFVDDSTTLRIVSVATNPNMLWDEDYGIYVLGTQYLNDRPFFGANFWDDTEIPVNIELYDPAAETHFIQDCGLKIHGGWTRSIPQKSIRPMAKGKYGEDYFREKLFSHKPIKQYKRFVLRNAGNDYYSCFFRDAFMHKLVQNKLWVDIQEYEPVIVYINGQYWGLHNMREKIDRYYLESNYGVDPERVDILEEQAEVISGENADFLQMMEFVNHNDLAIQDNFDRVMEELNMASYTDLILTNIFFINTDWPHNNMKWWREYGGKWNYFLMDLDMTSSIFTSNKPSVNQIERVFNDSVTVNTVLLRGMIENSGYRNYFINRYADLMNAVFTQNRMYALTDTIVNRLRPEMVRHKRRWGNQSAAAWETYYVENLFKGFIRDRHEHAREHLLEYFSLENQVVMHIDAYPDKSCDLHINTLYTDTMPFEGVYFNPVPITIEALPAPGYEFSYWKNIDSTWYSYDRIYEGIFAADDTLIAVCTGAPDTTNIVISELMHSPHPDVDCGHWLEIYSDDHKTTDLSGWKLMINNNLSGEIPDGTLLEPGTFLILAADTIAFYDIYPDSLDVVFLQDFSFFDYQTEITLLDNYHNAISVAAYGDAMPWPENTFFTGRANELMDPSLDPAVAENWMAGCLGGSPGRLPSDCHDYPAIIFTEYNNNSFHSHDTGDWVEIFNNDTIDVDMTGWIFRDAGDDHAYSFPTGFSLPSGEYRVIARDPVKFYEVHPEINTLSPFNFGLGESDSLLLFNRYGYEVVGIGYDSDTLWPNDINGTGRTAELIHPDSLCGNSSSWKNGCYGGTPMAGPESCRDNPDIVVTEIQYHPHEEYDGGTYFEIFNHDTLAIALQNWAVLNSDSIVSMTMEEYPTIEPGEYLVFAQNPTKLITIFPQANIYQYSTGITLSPGRNAFAMQDKFGITRLWMVYDVVEPWPVIEDSTGKALELLDYDRPYSDPENWFAGCKEGSPGHEFRPCDTTSIKEYYHGFSITPNPCSHKFTINNSTQNFIKTIRVISTDGDVIMNRHIITRAISTPVDISALPYGIYILEITTEKEIVYTKIIKNP